MPDFEPIRYRIRIGVTGHCALTDPPAVQALVGQAIDAEVDNLFPEDRDRTLSVFGEQA